MTQKRKKVTPADHLIDSLMDDLKDVGETSHSSNKFQADSSAEDLFAEPEPSAQSGVKQSPSSLDPEKTIALPHKSESAGSHNSAASSSVTQPLSSTREPSAESHEPPPVKVSYGAKRASSTSSNHGSVEHHLKQAENLGLAQARILDLEKQLDAVRLENDQLTSSMDVARSRLEETTKKINHFERSRAEAKEQAAIEQAMHRENLQARDYQIDRLKQKIEELEGRLNMDMKKIRVRERELENRLELSKAEKNALVRSKDDHILELKRKTEQMASELSDANAKAQELMQKIESNQDQFARTVRALRLALSNLEAHEETSSVNFTNIKKAE